MRRLEHTICVHSIWTTKFGVQPDSFRACYPLGRESKSYSGRAIPRRLMQSWPKAALQGCETSTVEIPDLMKNGCLTVGCRPSAVRLAEPGKFTRQTATKITTRNSGPIDSSDSVISLKP